MSEYMNFFSLAPLGVINILLVSHPALIYISLISLDRAEINMVGLFIIFESNIRLFELISDSWFVSI